MPFVLPDLPYAADALAPHMSAETLEFHHGKHHKAYVDKANALAAEKGLGGRGLVDLIADETVKADKPLFNNLAQIWNHSFFWQCLTPSMNAPSGKLSNLISEQFGSADTLVGEMIAEGIAHFGSGWAWLVLDDGKLKITSYHDADTPVAHGIAPLLTLDVWEHAYYIDYHNARPDYAKAVLEKIVDWSFVEQNLDGQGASRADQPG
jgi:superoxide dismutase, Fe-Mn family